MRQVVRMNNVLRTIDIEDALQAALNADGFVACAPPVPPTLGSTLPFVVLTRTGGSTCSLVQDWHYVSVDVYASTWADAQAQASQLTAWFRALAGTTLGGVPCYKCDINAYPYNNTDTDHPTIARVTFNAHVLTRVAHD